MKNVINKFEFNGLVLAGGRSARMGQDKALLRTDQGATLLECSQNLLHAAGASEVLISSNNTEITNAIADRYRWAGPVAGIDAGLHHTGQLPLLVLPVDMPLISADLLIELVQCGMTQATSVHFKEQCLPLFVFDCLAALSTTEALLSDGQCPSVWSLCRALGAQELEPKDASDDFFNANSPQQWQECRQRLDKASS